MTRVVKFDDCECVFTTIAEEQARFIDEAMKKELKKMCFMTGGAMVYNITQEYIDQVLINPYITEESRKEARLQKPCMQIIIVEDFFVTHTPEELDSIIYHEIGHIKHNHSAQLSEVNCEYAEGNIRAKLSFEIEADAYAASLTSKEVMKSALLKSIKYRCHMVKDKIEERGLDIDRLIEEQMNDPMFYKRIEALS